MAQSRPAFTNPGSAGQLTYYALIAEMKLLQISGYPAHRDLARVHLLFGSTFGLDTTPVWI